MTLYKSRRLSGALILGLILTANAGAQAPEGLNYQGFLVDDVGSPINAPVNVTFALYTLESGGVPVWLDTRVVIPSQGLFSTALGGVGSPFPNNLFDVPLFLGITVGADLEMTPRTALLAAPYALQALDAETVGGQTAASLDQSGVVNTLQSDVASVEADVSTLQTAVAGAQTAITSAQGDIAAVQSDVINTEGDISQLQTDLALTNVDLTTVENTLPTLQSRVSGTCAVGSSIRAISVSGTVICETDDAGLWSVFNSNVYFLTGNVGIGTSAPVASLQIDAPLGTDPFRARVQSSTKLRVHTNGSVSVGTSSAGPDDGLFVLGDARIGSGSSTARMTVTDSLWQAALDNSDTGGDDWFLGSSATGWAIGGGKFVISPTDSSTNAAVVVDSNKDVGIGVTNPLTRLHLGGGNDVSASGGGYLTLGGITGANIAIDSNEIMARSNGNVATLALNAEGGEVRINSGGSRDHDSLEIRGRVLFDNGENSGIRMTGTQSTPTNAILEPTLFEEALVGGSGSPFWRMYSREFYARTSFDYKTYSDRSLKQNVRPVPNALATIAALEGVTYELSKHPMDNRDRVLSAEEQYDRLNQLGFIAQDVEKVLPQMVSEDETSGLKSVGYMGVIPVLVEAIKEQQRQIEAQQVEIEELKRLIQ